MAVALKAEEGLIQVLEESGVEIIATVPCDRIRRLHSLIPNHFRRVDLTREEEGVAICAGAHLAGAKAAMLIQSSGAGNFINAICSLAQTYRIPLPILISWRGIYQESIPAQIPMGRYLPEILKAINVNVTIVEKEAELHLIKYAVQRAYRNSTVEAVLLSPRIWDQKNNIVEKSSGSLPKAVSSNQTLNFRQQRGNRELTRFEVIKAAAPFLDGKIVVSNLGIPSKELYYIKDQPSNFYMLGSMGMATPLGLGIAMNTSKQVVVIEGDGSILMNPGSLATAAQVGPKNLVILAIDNGCHGSTGNQPTAAADLVDLELVARGFGIGSTRRLSTESDITDAFSNLGNGPHFLHVLAKPGNAEVPDIPILPETIKTSVTNFLQNGD